jgi:hypothetical protein
MRVQQCSQFELQIWHCSVHAALHLLNAAALMQIMMIQVVWLAYGSAGGAYMLLQWALTYTVAGM